ncbi:MAG: aldo/keto reductase [Sphaerochaetaceae bacterium]
MARTNLGFGLMRLPCTDPTEPKSIDLPSFTRMADRFLEEGYTYFDTAYPYHNGMSEVAFREAVVKRHARDSFTVTDKMPLWFVQKSDDYQRIFEEQLARCSVTFFDYYWLHALNAERYETTKRLGGFEFLKTLKRDGKARHIGFSFHDKAEVLDHILTEQPYLQYVQLQINYIDWDDSSVQAEECYRTARAHGKEIIVMEPIKGGCLATIPPKAEKILRTAHPSWSNVRWALSFVASLPGIHAVLSGMNSISQVEENTALCKDMPLMSENEIDAIKNATKIIHKAIVVPCTACGYCKAGCPRQIDIPLIFSLYNSQAQYSLTAGLKRSYSMNVKKGSEPSACIGCRQCEQVCPQHLPITTLLHDAAKVFQNL